MTIDEARALKKGTIVIVRTPWGSDQEPLIFERWNEADQVLMVILPSGVFSGGAQNNEWPIGYETARAAG